MIQFSQQHMMNLQSSKKGMPMLLLATGMFCLLAEMGTAQNFGGNAPSVKWKQVNTPDAKVIFPKGMDSAASRIATVSQWLSDNHSGTIGDKHKKISIVLQPDGTYSNAFVALGPWRSEFYLTAPQSPFEMGSLSWLDNLAVHEYRHVQQYNNFNKGLSSFMGVLFGQNGRALANAVSVPDWFFEGDATWNETVHSGQGRGRLPLFLNEFKSVNEAGRKYSFMKMRNGSLRQFVPDHYTLGYLLVRYGRQAYGDSVWRNISNDAAAFRPLIYPMQGAFKKNTGETYSQFVTGAMNDFAQKNPANTMPAPQWITPASEKFVADYKYPYPADNGNVIVLKSGYRQIPTFTIVAPDGKESKIGVKDIGYDDYFSYRNGRIVYAALQSDPRWTNRSYSVIRLLDVKTKETFTIGHKSRYFAPDIAADGQLVVAVEQRASGRSLLVLVNTEGELQKSFTPDSSLFFSHPHFLSNETEILAAARKPNGQMGWMIWNTASNEVRWLLAPADRLVGFPVVKGDTITYTATEGGQDALYAQLYSTGKRFRLAAYSTGIYQGFLDGNRVVASCFSAYGYRLGTFQPGWTPTVMEKPTLATLYHSVDGEKYGDVSQLATRQLEAKKYSKLSHPFNFHSWQPEVDDNDYTLRIMGNNVINTVLTDLYYTYNTNESSHAAGVNLAYGQWFLQPVVGGKQTWGREVLYNADTTFIYNETEAYAGFRLPLNFSGGRSYKSLSLSATVHSDMVRWKGLGDKLLKDLNYAYMQARLSYTSQVQKARQQIYPRFAQSLYADYRSMIDENNAWQMLASGSLYLPGLSGNHSLVLNVAYQARDTMREYVFSNSFPFSRGYTSVNYPRMFKFGANYHFPIVYPDWGFGNMLYLLRIRGNAFYDFTNGKSLRTGLSRSFTSVGGELFFDTKVWNQLPVSFGMRYSYLLESEYDGSMPVGKWELVLPINIL